MQVTLNVKDSEWTFLSGLLQKFDFVQVQPTDGDEPSNPAAANTATESTASTAPAEGQGLTEDKEKKAELVDWLWANRSYLHAQIVDKCFTFKLSPTCWAKFSDLTIEGPDNGFQSMSGWVGYVVEYCKREGIGDLEKFDSKNKEERPMIDEIIENLRSKFSLTIEALVECRGKAYMNMNRYPYAVLERIGRDSRKWSPKSGEAHFTVSISPDGDDIDIKISPDGKQFFITTPAYIELYGDISNKIYTSLERVNKNR